MVKSKIYRLRQENAPLKRLLKHVNPIQTLGKLNVEIPGIAFDSRQVKKNYIFVAIQGFKQDGNDFKKQAMKTGAVAIVTENPTTSSSVTSIQVENARIALAKLAAAFYDFPHNKLHLIGITGTNGKTTTAYLIRSIFEAAGRPTGLLGTIEYIIGNERLPSQLTTPESLHLNGYLSAMVEFGQKHAVMEASSHGIAMERTHGLHFKNVVFTNLTHDHLDFHKSEEAYLAAKTRLFENLTSDDFALVNADDSASRTIQNQTRAQVFFYSLKDPSADFFAEEGALNGQKIVSITGYGHKFEVTTKLIGHHNSYNILTAAAVGLLNEIKPDEIKTGIENLDQIPGRLEAVECGQHFHVFVDFAHNPDALKQTLLACRQIAEGKVIVVFGCGGARDPGKRPIMGKVAEELADLVFLTSDNPRREDPLKILEEIEQGILNKTEIQKISDRKTAIYEALHTATNGDAVLIAGKGHETYQDTNGEKRDFDDRIVAKEILEEMTN